MRCNLDCAYCYISDRPLKKSGELRSIDILQLMRTLDATNKIFLIEFTGGEPFLVPNIIEACMEITKKHYVGIVTNLTCDNIQEFAEKINPKRVYRIAMSMHIKELERHNLVEKVINNFLLCQRKGMNIDARIVAYPPLLNEAQEYRNFFKNKGIDIKFKIFHGKYNGKVYPKSYNDEEIEGFGFNRSEINKYYQYQGICNAGFNVGMVGPNGDIHLCNRNKSETTGNICKKIEFKKYLVMCPVRYCGYKFKQYQPYLFQIALEQNSTIFKKIVPIVHCFFWLSYDLTRRLIGKLKKML